MVRILTGENDFTRTQRKRDLVATFVKTHGDLALEILDGEEATFDRIREALESLPFLASKKLVVLLSPGANKEFLDKCKDLLSNVPETTDVIIDEPKFDKRSSYYKYAKKLDGFEMFDPLQSIALEKWAGDYVKKWDAQIESSAARELVARMGVDQLKISTELDKLSMYTDKITVEDIKELTVQTPSSTIFELIDAAFSGNKKRALNLYDEQRVLQVDPIQIVAMFTWQFHVLALVKSADGLHSADIAKQAKLNPYVVQKTERISRNVSAQKIKQEVSRLREIDQKMKTSKINADDALKAFIISL